MEQSNFVYVTYIATTPDKVWNALTDPKLTAKYWQHENVSDWKPGSRWEHRSSEGDGEIHMVGKVVEVTPPRKLVLTWVDPEEEEMADKYSRVTISVEPHHDTTRLTVTHDRLEPGSEMLEAITDGWPMVLSSLKSLLETGRPLPKLW